VAGGTSASVGAAAFTSAVVGMASAVAVVSGSTAGSAATGTATGSVAGRRGSGSATDKVGSGPIEVGKVSGSGSGAPTELTSTRTGIATVSSASIPFPCSISTEDASALTTGGMSAKFVSNLIGGPAGGVGKGSVMMIAGPASMTGMGELISSAEDETVLFSAAFTGTIVMGTLGARGDTGISESTAGGAQSEASSVVAGSDSRPLGRMKPLTGVGIAIYGAQQWMRGHYENRHDGNRFAYLLNINWVHSDHTMHCGSEAAGNVIESRCCAVASGNGTC